MTARPPETDFDRLKARELALLAERGDLFTRYFGLPLSLRITRFFLEHDWSADTASKVMWICGMTGALCFTVGLPGILIGSVLLLLHHVMDYVDGQLARHKDMASVQGAAADRLNHFSVEAATYLALGVGLYQMHPTLWSALLPWLLFIWNRFRVLVDSLPQLIYHNELTVYPRLERRMMLTNLGGEGDWIHEGQGGRHCDTNPAPKEWWPRIREKLATLRVATTSYNFFTMYLCFGAALQLALRAVSVEVPVVLSSLAFLAVYYLLNMLDYAVTYLRTDRVSHEVIGLVRGDASSKDDLGLRRRSTDPEQSARN